MVKVCPLDPVKVGSRKKESLGEKVSSDQMGPNFTYLIGVWFPKSKANELLRQERVVRSFRVIWQPPSGFGSKKLIFVSAWQQTKKAKHPTFFSSKTYKYLERVRTHLLSSEDIARNSTDQKTWCYFDPTLSAGSLNYSGEWYIVLRSFPRNISWACCKCKIVPSA